MPKRTTSSPAAGLIEQLMPLRSDPGKLQEALASCDSVLVGDAFARLLAVAAFVEENDEKRPKLARVCTSLPAETFVDVVLFASRDTIDSMMLSCRFMLDCIRKLKTHQLVLRTLQNVLLAIYWGDDTDHLQYDLSISRKLNGDEATWMNLSFRPNLAMPCFPLLNGFMRLAYCKSVRIAFSGPARLMEERFRVERDRLFANLVAQETFVAVLSIDCSDCCTEEIADLRSRSVQSFKSVTTVALDAGNFGRGRPERFTEDFFVSLARQGVRTLDVMMPGIDIDVGPALAFGFAEPACGGRRALSGVRCANGSNFLEQLRKKASELDANDSVDFEFSIMSLAGDIDGTGFAKYQKDEGKWLVDDLENRVILAIEKTEETVEVKVRSSL